MRSWSYLVVAIVGLPSRRLSVGVKLQALGLLSWGQSLRGRHSRRLHLNCILNHCFKRYTH